MKKMALLVKINAKNEAAVIAKAAGFLKRGNVIIYPTETSYAIGADALNAKAVARIHRIKKQDASKPISVIVPNIEIAEKLGRLTEKARLLAEKFMPGPLTIIIPKKNHVPKELTRHGIAFRISSNRTAKLLSKDFGGAITATSANIHKQLPIHSAKEALEKLGEKVDLIIDAGELPKINASTIYDAESGKVLRHGPVAAEEIENALLKTPQHCKRNEAATGYRLGNRKCSH